jgi:hypothetical protein
MIFVLLTKIHYKKYLMRMCYEPFTHKFDLWFEKICNMNPTYKEWIEREPKEK